MAKYAQKLTKEDLIIAGIKDIWYDTNDSKYHILNNSGKEVKLYKNKQHYLYFTIYKLDENGNKIKRPTKIKDKRCKKEIDSYVYALRTITLHRAIYVWFKSEVPDGYIVDHIDNKHDTHYDSRPENLQLLTPAENLAKERPTSNTDEIPCDMKKPLEHYIDKYNYWTLEYEREKEERSSSTEYAHKCRCFYNIYRKKIRYWFRHQNEYEDYIKLESARISAQDYIQERASKINQYKQEIKQAKKISKELWHQKVEEYNTFLKNFPFTKAEELEKMFLDQVLQ